MRRNGRSAYTAIRRDRSEWKTEKVKRAEIKTN